MVLQQIFGSCHELGVLFFSLFLSIPEICLAKFLLDMCFTRALYISFKFVILTVHVSVKV